MTRMIPARPRAGANTSEKRIFDAFAGAHDADDWIVLHSLEIRRHATQFQGEADFIVLVPRRGIVVVEAKSPEYVEYKDGEWRLDRVPNPGKSPFGQLDGSIRRRRRRRSHSSVTVLHVRCVSSRFARPTTERALISR